MGQHKTKTFEFPSIATADREKQSKRRFERYAVDCLAFVKAEGHEKSHMAQVRDMNEHGGLLISCDDEHFQSGDLVTVKLSDQLLWDNEERLMKVVRYRFDPFGDSYGLSPVQS